MGFFWGRFFAIISNHISTYANQFVILKKYGNAALFSFATAWLQAIDIIPTIRMKHVCH